MNRISGLARTPRRDGRSAADSVDPVSVRDPVYAGEPERQACQHAREQHASPEHPLASLSSGHRVSPPLPQLDDPPKRIAEIRHDSVHDHSQDQGHRFYGVFAQRNDPPHQPFHARNCRHANSEQHCVIEQPPQFPPSDDLAGRHVRLISLNNGLRSIGKSVQPF
jgi:hypothetical protein